jgi:four helix bundle protein
MTYHRFEDLPVWKDAIELKLQLDEYCSQPAVRVQRNFVGQIDGAGLSVSNNIAEGFERGTTSELIYFLYVARGSAGEVRSMLRYQAMRPDGSATESETDALIARCESISRQLGGWTNSLQNSDIAGPRHLNHATRAQYDQTKRSQAFAEKLRAQVEADLEAKRRARDSMYEI